MWRVKKICDYDIYEEREREMEQSNKYTKIMNGLAEEKDVVCCSKTRDFTPEKKKIIKNM